jgi:putative flippase GtrA
MAIYAVMYFMNINPLVANAVGYGLGLIVSFALNKMWTFQNTAPVAESLPKYVCVAAVAYIINISVVSGCIYIIKLDPYVAQLGGIAFYTATMFLACRIFVFKTSV